MSIVHINHIRKKLEDDFCPHVDMSDYDGKPAAQRDSARLSRALAAFVLAESLGVTPAAACGDIVDGFDDHGIDAIGVSAGTRTVVVVQSKWDANGKGSPALGDVEKFARGFSDLLIPRFERFNEKVRKNQATITAALDNTDVQFEFVLVHTGQQPLSKHAQRVLDDLVAETNDPAEVVRPIVLGQAQVHGMIRQGVAGKAPDLTVTLHDWGATQEPFRAFYGQVEAAEVAEWWDEHRATLFDRNLRKFIHDSEVNSAITSTLLSEPANFWYFNNGITVLCDRIKKAAVGGANRRTGRFDFEGATVVNGAQTVGSIGRASATDPSKVADARVHVRFISLDECPPDFAEEVTRATNTQNRVERRDFVALDPEQERLRTDLKLSLDKIYVTKTGEVDPGRDHGCTVVDATVALACAESPDLAVQAKREIGRLWDDVSKPPYKALFNSRTTATRLWRAVEVQRAVEATLREKQKTLEGKERTLAVHGNRLIAHLVFASLPSNALNDAAVEFDPIQKSVEKLTTQALVEIWTVIQEDYPSKYVAALCKNMSRCREIVEKVPALTPA